MVAPEKELREREFGRISESDTVRRSPRGSVQIGWEQAAGRAAGEHLTGCNALRTQQMRAA